MVAPAGYVVVDGKVVARRLELGAAEHCNLSCRSCSHLSPVLPRRYLDPSAVSDELRLLGRHYHVGTVRLLGGEPLLHPRLVELIAVIRASEIGDAVTVVTNGVLLPRMKADFWESVDEVIVALYPGKELAAEDRRTCDHHAAEFGATIAYRPYRYFRESYSEVGTTDESLVRAIYRSCAVVHEWRCHTLAEGRFYKCPQSYYLPRGLASCGDNQVTDSIAVNGSESFREELIAFLDSPDPLRTCGNCLGTAGRRFRQEQIRRSDFRTRQERPAEDLIDPVLLGGRTSRPRRLLARIAACRRPM